MLQCGHSFCRACIEASLRRRLACPQCAAPQPADRRYACCNSERCQLIVTNLSYIQPVRVVDMQGEQWVALLSLLVVQTQKLTPACCTELSRLLHQTWRSRKRSERCRCTADGASVGRAEALARTAAGIQIQIRAASLCHLQSLQRTDRVVNSDQTNARAATAVTRACDACTSAGTARWRSTLQSASSGS